MKYLILYFFMTISILSIGQNSNKDSDNLTIGVIIVDQAENIDNRSAKYLEDKMLNALSFNGISGLYPNFTYVMYPIISIVDKEMTSTAPFYYSMNIDLTMFISDYENSTIFGNYMVKLKGVGKSEVQAYQNAFKDFDYRNRDFQNFISETKLKIIDYIDNNCDLLIDKAKTKAIGAHFVVNNKKIDGRRQALSILSSIDNSNEDCYQKALQLMNSIYEELRAESCNYYLQKAQTYISVENYGQAINCILAIPSSSKCRDEIIKVIEIIKAQKMYDKEVELAMMIHKDNKELEFARIDAMKVIGSAYMKYLSESNKYNYRRKGVLDSNINIQINK